MPACEVCGNEYDKAFTVTLNHQTHTFDCFECAIHRLAPACDHCGCRIVGHGAEADDRLFCSAHCARQEAEPGISDRAPGPVAVA